MQLGAFSVSLNVKDIDKSLAFYEAFGFSAIAGDKAQGYLILRNGTTTIGLFQGMFDANILTFNPGWDAECNTLDSFTDVRELQRQLQANGIELVRSVDETGSGPGSITAIDPDGNPILIDQHV
tara:strand:- start:2661 stop:3032 length:372 start_codon:yes stop_codon:yes gene_type:complete